MSWIEGGAWGWDWEPKIDTVEREADSSAGSSERPAEILQIKSTGWYIDCVIFDQSLPFLIDSGASCSLIDKALYDTFLKDSSVRLKPVEQSFVLADGSGLKVYGQVQVDLEIGDRLIAQELVVAELGATSAILGLDFLENNDAALRPSRGHLLIGDGSIPAYREGLRMGVLRISLVEAVSIEPQSIKIMDAKVEVNARGMEKMVLREGGVGVVERATSLLDGKGVLVSNGLVRIQDGEVLVNLMNVHDQPIFIPKGSSVGFLHQVAGIHELATKENIPSPVVSEKILDENDIPEHLHPVLEGASELTAEQKSEVCNVMLEVEDQFLSPGGKTGRTDWDEHGMDMQNNRPSKVGYRRLPVAKQVIADREVERMLKDDVIEPSNSPWASPIVLVTKKDGSVRFCVDYRRVNELTCKDAYPLPQIDETLDTLGGTQWFCTMDLASGYWQIKMKECDKPKTAFVTRKGLFQFKVMPFGLCNAPATFQRLMERVLMGLQWEQCLVYLDDIIVFGKTFEETLDRLRRVLNRLKAAGLKLKPSKCRWFQRSVTYLGHVVSGEGIKCDPEKIEKVQNWPVPKTVPQVRAFIGIASYYRKFIPNFSEICAPLTNLTRKDIPYLWSEECQASFDTLKTKLTTAPILSYPKPDEGPFILDTDASNTGIGAVLLQVQGGEELVIAYASHTLNEAERNYCTTKKELLAVVYAVEHFRHYLYGQDFIIRTDHASLKWLKNFKNADGLLARWLAKLETYHFTFTHRKGSAHGNADALSRMPTRKCPRSDCPQCSLPVRVITETETETGQDWLEGWTKEDIRQWQRDDPNLGQIIKWMEDSSERPDGAVIAGMSKDIKAFWNQWDVLQLKNGLLYRKWFPFESMNHRAGPKWQLVAPNEIRRQILVALHDSPSGGHLGVSKTVNKVRHRFYWLGYKQDVVRWCKKCDHCSQTKSGPWQKKARLGHVVVGNPLERVAVDILGPVPETENGNQYILVVTDYFTKWVEAFPLRDHPASTVAEVLMEQFISRFGVPKQIHSDQGREFESKLMAELCKLLKIKKTRTTPYNPKSDGLVERFNRTVKQMLTMLVADAQNDWDDHLPYVMMAYRASIHESTKCTPNLLMLNREVNLPIDLMVGSPSEDEGPVCPVEYVEWVRLATEEAFEFVRKNLRLSALRQKQYYDQGCGEPQFHPGQSVWRYYPPSARQKFGKSWKGHF